MLCRTIYILLIAFLANFGLHDFAHAEHKNLITVRGFAKESFEPNTAKISFALRLRDANQVELKTRAANVFEIFDAQVLKKHNVAQDQYQTKYFNISPIFTNCSNGSAAAAGAADGIKSKCDINKVVGYNYYKAIEISIVDFDIEKIAELLLDATKVEELSVQNVWFEHSDIDKLREVVMMKALQNAKASATALLNSIDLELGEVKSIEVGQNNPPYFRSQTFARAASASAVAESAQDNLIEAFRLNPEPVDIESQLTAAFEIRS